MLETAEKCGFMAAKGQRNHLGVDQTTLQEERNCMNVPSNVKWRIFYTLFFFLFSCVHFSVLLFCASFILESTKSWSKECRQDESAVHHSDEPVRESDGCQTQRRHAVHVEEMIQICDMRCISTSEMQFSFYHHSVFWGSDTWTGTNMRTFSITAYIFPHFQNDSALM